MAQAARLNLRMQKELKLLLNDPPPGASFPLLSADSDHSSLSTIHAQIEGPEGTVYAKGIFSIKIQIPERYPFQPPIVSFATPIYHPNIDNGGRICLDILNLPPKGAWQPSLNISTVLMSIGLLLSEPNPDDGLMCEASKEYKYNRQVFDQKARSMTEKYAMGRLSGHNRGTNGIEIKSDSSMLMEIKDSGTVPNYKNIASVPAHKKICGISSRLSLENTSSTHKKNNDVVINDNQNSQPLFDFNDHVEAKEDREGMRSMPEACTLRYEKLCNTRKKLSLDSSLQHHNTEVLEPKHSPSIFNPQVLSMVAPPLQISNNHDQPLQQHHDNKPTVGSKNINWGQVRESIMIGSSCVHQPSQSYGNSTGSLSLFPSDNHDEVQSTKDSIDKMEKGSTDIKCEKVLSISKKLSLGTRGLSQKQEDKENVLPIQKFPFSNPQTPRKIPISGNQSLGRLFELQGSNEDNSQLISHLHNSSMYDRGQQCTLHQNGKTAGVTKRQKQESPTAESLIVWDSEDSEEESNRSVGSKLSSIQKCAVKRKTRQP